MKTKYMWALMSPSGYLLVAFRTKAAAMGERVRFRPETKLVKIWVKP